MAHTGREFHIPQKTAVRENATSSKTRIVDDASARANESVPSLNNCQEVDPSLQNQPTLERFGEDSIPSLSPQIFERRSSKWVFILMTEMRYVPIG